MKKAAIAITLCALIAFLLEGCATVPPYTAYSDPDSLAKLIAEKSRQYFLVDVRTAEEYASGHIPTAVNIPVDRIAAQAPTPDKKAIVIVYCASGMRSARAASTLVGLGYDRVVDFGSVSKWKDGLVKGTAAQ
jgi:phage shock protein E